MHPSKNANGTKKRLAESTRPDERSDDISKSPRVSGGFNGNDVGELSYDECKIAYKMFNETASELLYDQELHSSKQDISILTPFPDDEDKEIDWVSSQSCVNTHLLFTHFVIITGCNLCTSRRFS